MSTTNSNSGIIQVFNYKSKGFISFPLNLDITCEEICIRCCKTLNILPPSKLLFGLRVSGTEKWLMPNRELKPTDKYEFRMRFKVYDLFRFQKTDPNAYEYLYYQIRHDLISDKLADIRYPAYKDKVMGLGVVDMYIDHLELKIPAEDIVKNYKQYLPKQLVKMHKIFARNKICDGFLEIRKKSHPLSYLKRSYLLTIMGLSPNYLMETYNAIVDKLPEEDGNNEPYPVTVRLDPFNPEGPALQVSVKYAIDWQLFAKLENICALHRDGKRYVTLDISGSPREYQLEFAKPMELKSFISYLSGYLRLTTKWMLDLCPQFLTPSLEELNKYKCHGPVGGDFSYNKIREKQGKCGSYIIRQCEREYDVYYIDINSKGTQTETFKITRNRDTWQLHINDEIHNFNNLSELVHSIPTSSEKFRIQPSVYDKPPLLLICLPGNMLPKKTDSELNEAQLLRKPVQIFDPVKDLQWYKNSERECDDGKMVSVRADWIQPQNVQDVQVNLKYLKHQQDFSDFMKLANTWSRIDTSEFIKLYGITLTTPYTMIMESAKYGPLNELLYNLGDKVPMECLLDALYGLVCGIAYLQAKDMIHGNIRCSYLLVTKFDPKKHLLITKISDPGLPKPYTLQDLPWIPLSYHKDLEAAKTDPQAELWAFSTTMWEIFARGKPLTNLTADILSQNYIRHGYILPQPPNCPDSIYDIMMDGWSTDPDKRFNQQAILTVRFMTKKDLVPNYEKIDSTLSYDDSSLYSNSSNATDGTSQTFLNGHSSSDVRSWGFSTNSLQCDRVPLLRGHNGMSQHSSYFDDTPSVKQIPGGKIIYRGKIGEGHYGIVYRGELHYNKNYAPEQVAIKTLKSNNGFSEDFMREIKIMQELNHPNIVKIKMTCEDPVSIIMEYVQGSFNVYLASNKPILTNKELLHFALQIAKGMEYLRSKKVIHRDLAARNILIDSERCIAKISDFGLAQIANNDGYYIAKSTRDIPIKWYAPESITSTKFSFQSDVWSYGVTLFEMFSRGDTPNLDPERELSQFEFLKRLENGHRLRRPELCPEDVYINLMMPCWHENPKKRPIFKEIVEIVESIIKNTSDCI